MPCDDGPTEKAPTDPSTPSTPEQNLQRKWSMGSYPRLSAFMGSWPDIAIFRRFGTLNAQNLLFLQAELSHLERELQIIREREEKSEDEEKQNALRSWYSLSESSLNGEENPQWPVLLGIRERLAEYNKALLEYKEICSLHGPSKHDLECLREWLERPKCGDNFLRGVEREVWHSQQPHQVNDLVTMSRTQTEKDPFTKWLSDTALGWYHRSIGHKINRPYDEESGMYHYKQSALRAVSHLFGILFASTIPAASIFTLYYVTDMVARLGAILAFSALFSICLAVFTTARRVEIFAATAAYVLFMSIMIFASIA